MARGDEGEGRIEALETKLSFEERTVSELSAEVFSQARRIERLEKLLRDLASKVKELSDSGEPSAPGDVRPPHW